MVRRQLERVRGSLGVLGAGLVQLVGVVTGKRAWEDWGRIRRQRAPSTHVTPPTEPIAMRPPELVVAAAAAPPPPPLGKRGRQKAPSVHKTES